MEYYRIEPFGPLMDAHFAGTIACSIYNSKRTKKSTGKAIMPSDFFPVLKPRPQTVEEQKAAMLAWAEASKSEPPTSWKRK